MNRASSATGWVRNPTMKSPDLDPHLASSYELGWTWNPITGCLNHTPEGLCLGGMFPCYAFRLANGRLRSKYRANSNLPTHDEPDHWRHHADPFYPRFWPERLMEPLHLGKGQFGLATIPRGVFVCDMSDLFGIGIPEEWTKRVMDTIKDCPQHRFYTLTKHPEYAIKFSPFPENCWVGVTATNMRMLADACYILKRVQAKVKYISVEPFLDFNRTDDLLAWNIETALFEAGIGWLIIGAQTKPYLCPQKDRIGEIVSAADHAGTSVFLKDNLKPLLETLSITGGSFGRLTSLTVEALKDTQGLPRQRGWYQLRQEMPK